MTRTSFTGQVGDQIFSRQLKLGTLDLFLYSAAAWITHRTHYDRDFAVSEGHEGVLVHGPLQGAHMIEPLNDWASANGGKLQGVGYRHLVPLVADTAIVISATVEQLQDVADGTLVRVVLAIDKASGERCTSGWGTVLINKKGQP